MRPLAEQIELLERFAEQPVIAVTLNHEGMSRPEVEATVVEYERSFGRPVCDPLWHGVGKVVDELTRRRPEL
jgi:uncharacterized NAD-dependent epimerase/dehydratase family protein